jgi:hypothetical protein
MLYNTVQHYTKQTNIPEQMDKQTVKTTVSHFKLQ